MLSFRTDADVIAAVPRVKAHLDGDGLLAYPTETVYGLGSAPSERGLGHLALLKGRAANKPFLLLISGTAMLDAWGLVLGRHGRALAREFWPGPLTLVLRGGEGKLPDRLRGQEGGIAVRWTSHGGMAKLIKALGHPLTSTSAN